ncbi:MAG: hypothetical protein ACFFDN_24885 [Candidatus Hodarchaeota archaeon]
MNLYNKVVYKKLWKVYHLHLYFNKTIIEMPDVKKINWLNVVCKKIIEAWIKVTLLSNFKYKGYHAIIKQLKEQNKFHTIKNIYGIPRGGLFIALQLSHITGLPVTNNPTDSTLVVDDITNTGHVLQNWTKFTIAVLFYNPDSKVKPDAYGYRLRG